MAHGKDLLNFVTGGTVGPGRDAIKNIPPEATDGLFHALGCQLGCLAALDVWDGAVVEEGFKIH